MTKNLENLVTQLQSMESSMISVMFDLATKLASLSDISFLLLVESQGGTKFTGSRHLTDAFLMSNLSQYIESDGQDVEMQYDPNPLPRVVLPHKTGVRGGLSSKKRRFADSIQSLEEVDSMREFVGKRLRFAQSDAADDVIIEEANDPSQNSARPDEFQSRVQNPDPSIRHISGRSQSERSATEFNGIDSPQLGAYSSNNNLVSIDRNRGSFIEQRDSVGEEGGGGRGEEERVSGESDNNLEIIVKEENGLMVRSNSHVEEMMDDSLIRSYMSTHSTTQRHQLTAFPDDYEWDVKEFLENSEKLKFIAKIETASVVLDKDSTEFKLLHSLIYELSKTAATFCPFVEASDPRTSQYFSNVFDTFWTYVPFLQRLHVEGVLPGNKATSKYKNLKSLLRWKMQKNFGVLMKKYNIRCKT